MVAVLRASGILSNLVDDGKKGKCGVTLLLSQTRLHTVEPNKEYAT
jgi:hypothetical protein